MAKSRADGLAAVVRGKRHVKLHLIETIDLSTGKYRRQFDTCQGHVGKRIGGRSTRPPIIGESEPADLSEKVAQTIAKRHLDMFDG